MIGQIYKDILIQRKTLWYYLFLMAVYAFLTITDFFDVGMLGGIVAIAGSMMSMSAFAYDEQSKWEAFGAAMPNGRRNLAAGRYGFFLLGTLGSAAAILVLSLVLHVLGLLDEGFEEMLVVMAACVLVAVLVNCVTIPLTFHFGAEKSRVITMIAFGVFFAVVLFFALRLEEHSEPAWLGLWLIPVMVLALLAALAVSFLIAVRICEKKEY